jgi:hypothetical protein
MTTYDVKYHAVGVHYRHDLYEDSGSGDSTQSSGAWVIDEVVRDVAFIGHQPAGAAVAEDIDASANARIEQRTWSPQSGEKTTTCEGNQKAENPVGAVRHGPEVTTAGVPVEWIPIDHFEVPLSCSGASPAPRELVFSEGDVLNAHYLVPLDLIGSPSFSIKIKSKPDQCARQTTNTVNCRDSWSGTVTYTRTKIEVLGKDEPDDGQGSEQGGPQPPPPPKPPAPPVIVPPGGGPIVVGSGPKAPRPCAPTPAKPCVDEDGDATIAVACAKACRGTVRAYGAGRASKRPLVTRRFARPRRGTATVRLRLPRGTRRVVVTTTPRGGKAQRRVLPLRV